MAKVTMPQLGESVAEGTIGKWLKQPGDHVDKYEPLVEVKGPAEVRMTQICVDEDYPAPGAGKAPVPVTAPNP